MKHHLIKLFSVCLALAATLSLALPAFADMPESEEVTVEVIPNEIADAALPEELRNAILNSEIAPYGQFKPSSSDVYDLSTGKYSFTMYSKLNSTIYSKYVFKGHGGGVSFVLNDNADNSGDYSVKVYKRGLFDTTVYTKKNCTRGGTTTFDVSISDTDALIYFAIIPNGTTSITTGSYISKQ